MNRKTAFLAVLVVLAIALTAQAALWEGSGTESDPYLIYDANDMQAIGADPNYWDSHFQLMSDIDLSRFTGTQFNIIGYGEHLLDGEPFGGVFDGNGHTISNFSYTGSERGSVGLFGSIAGQGSEIRNLGLINPNVSAPSCKRIGALAGSLDRGLINHCYVIGGYILGSAGVGGLVGRIASFGTIEDSYSIATVTGEEWVGGLLGAASQYSTGNINISRCFSNISVSGLSYVGGLMGSTSADHGTIKIANCYSIGVVTGNFYVGGLVGRNGCNGNVVISSTYSAAAVSGNTYVGGLFGKNNSSVGCYVNVLMSFWDIDTSGQTGSDGGIGKTTDEMQMENTFTSTGWDFVGETVNGTEDIWYIEESEYPRLWWEKVNSTPVADAGADQTAYACADGMAEVKLDGSGSYDADGDELTYLWSWIVDSNEMTATGIDPNIELPVGEHIIELIVNDGIEDSEPNEVVITVIGLVEADVHIVPRTINRQNRMKRIMAIIRLPEGINKHDIADEPFVLEPGQIEPIWDRVIGRGNQATVFALFDKDEVMAALPDTGRVELTIVGKLESGQCISGTDTIRIVRPRRRRMKGLRF